MDNLPKLSETSRWTCRVLVGIVLIPIIQRRLRSNRTSGEVVGTTSARAVVVRRGQGAKKGFPENEPFARKTRSAGNAAQRSHPTDTPFLGDLDNSVKSRPPTVPSLKPCASTRAGAHSGHRAARRGSYVTQGWSGYDVSQGGDTDSLRRVYVPAEAVHPVSDRPRRLSATHDGA